MGIEFKNIVKSYDGKTPVIKDFNLSIDDGQFVVILGPSGCGKSTLLRIMAGLEDIDQGTISIDGKVVNNLEPKDRNIAMVFQDYALYPHMSVYKNIGMNLILKKLPKDQVDAKVLEVAKILEIEDLLDRKPRQLSGGQQQRVALARAMVRDPKVFLMDEPLSNLDAKLRTQTRSQIIDLYRRLGTTTIYVTHDQTEAMTMATCVVVMKDGVIQQMASPEDIYKKPENMFVAGFIGTPQMNFIKKSVDAGKVSFGKDFIYVGQGYKKVYLGARPEDIQIVEGDRYEVVLVENLGPEKLIYLKGADGQKVSARCSSDIRLGLGDRCDITLNLDKVCFFDCETEKRIKLES